MRLKGNKWTISLQGLLWLLELINMRNSYEKK